MFGLLLTSVVSFLSTNIDDLFVLAFLYLQADTKKDKRLILAGRYVGLFVILAISLAGAFGLGFLPKKYLGLLGLFPIALGIKEWITYKRAKGEKEASDEDVENKKKSSPLLSATVLTVSNGADNICVYVPLLAGFSATDFPVFIAVFVLMTALWCFLSAKLANVPAVKNKLQRYGRVLVPILFILLGVYILLKSYL